MMRVFVILVALGAVAAAGAAAWLHRALSPVAEDPARAQVIAFEVAPGDTLGRVAADLEARGVVRSSRVTRWFAHSEDIASKLKVGEYALSTGQSTPEILSVLVEGRVRTHPVVIPEGLRATEIADRLEAEGFGTRRAFLDVVFDRESPKRLGVEGESLEGYLFPDTYRFARGVSETRIAEAMVGRFLEVYRELLEAHGDPRLSMREHVTLASIVEKETGAAHERPLIAAVFLNRLERGMRLETDPTVIYGIPGFDGNLRRVHLEDSGNPYNTYKLRGLPPGPIASPGRDALEAVLEPAESSYLYFVSRNDGTHVFSKTYAEHERAVDRFQRRRGRR